MAGFKTHITASTVVGVGYGYLGLVHFGLPLQSCLLAGGMCSISGMLPDLDSDSGVPLRETTLFASAVVPMLLIDRLQDLGVPRESMVLAACVVYLLMRFAVVGFFRRYTVHRGMWHSIPAAISMGLFAYLAMHCAQENIRVFKAVAVFTGFMVHLILDEIWSIEFGIGGLRLKKSFGTAMKFWGKNLLANFSVYAKLAVLIYMAYNDRAFMTHTHLPDSIHMEQIAEPWFPTQPQQNAPELWR